MNNIKITLGLLGFVLCASAAGYAQAPAEADTQEKRSKIWNKIAPYFSPPAEYADKYGDYRPLLEFYGGQPVETEQQWQKRKEEIQDRWHSLMGEWPSLLKDQELEIVNTIQKEGYTQHRIRFKWTPGDTTEGYLLIPDGEGPHPAVITVYYEPETAIGEGKQDRDYAYDLTQRGFVTLSLGTTEASENKTYSLYYPSIEEARVEPLSMLAYAAANAWHALAKVPEVDSSRIGIMGHSFGGKWAMFASALFDKFAASVWSDPGIVFDETKGSAVNYWEPWYLGYYPPPWENTWRKTGMTEDARGLYPKLVREGYDLHELHALTAPRPFLVSGGSSDPEERWTALNHSIGVNKLLGYDNRVAMTNRPDHDPNERSNEVAYLFFEYFLKYNGHAGTEGS